MKTIDLEIVYGGELVPISSKSREKDYPTFTVERDSELDIPEEGVMSIRYRKVRSSESVDKSGDEHYSCTIEVQAIEDVEEEADEERSSTNDTADALDELMKKHMTAKKNSKKEKY